MFPSKTLSNKHGRYPQVKLGPSKNWITQKCVALLEMSMFDISSFSLAFPSVANHDALPCSPLPPLALVPC